MAALNKTETKVINTAIKILQEVREGTFRPDAEPTDMRVLGDTVASLSILVVQKGSGS